MKQISKFLALILRHKPEVGGLRLDAEGWADVEAVLAAIRQRFGDFDRRQLDELVRTSDKQRYAFDESGGKIRANQGHSIPIDLKLTPVAPPPLLYHGTSERLVGAILEQGLVRGRRHHVHLSPDLETAMRVGARRSGRPVVLQVWSRAMAEHLFFRSANDVWLTDHVPPAYLRLLD